MVLIFYSVIEEDRIAQVRIPRAAAFRDFDSIETMEPVTIGNQVFPCEKCHALQYHNEASISCVRGRIATLPQFPRPSPLMEELLTGESEDEMKFRRHIRPIIRYSVFIIECKL